MKKALLLLLIAAFTFACSDDKLNGNSNTVNGKAVMIDIDGNVYPTINMTNRVTTPVISNGDSTIGQQVWTTKNLNVSRYRNGDPIPQVTDKEQWGQLTTGAWCYYENNSANGPIYGKLYNWYAVNDPRGLAPNGYHIPSDAEWGTLINFLGGQNVAGGKMKANSPLWATPNVGVTTNSSFMAQPSGYRQILAPEVDFLYSTYFAAWWSTTSPDPGYAWHVNVSYQSASIIRGAIYKRSGFSVRCIKN